MASEKNFENRLRDWLDFRGIWQVKYFANRNTLVGIPDVLACGPHGKFMGLELKGNRGKPSPLQIWHARKICQSGGIGLIIWPEDFDAFKSLVMRLEAGEEYDDLIFSGIYLHEMP